MEAAAMTAGPMRNRTAIANAASLFPQAMICSCNAMNKPRLNIAIPSPASDRIKIDRAMIVGISIPHLGVELCDRVGAELGQGRAALVCAVPELKKFQ